MSNYRDRDVREGARELFWGLHDARTYSCPGCGTPRDETSAIHVHHLDGNPTNNDRENLVGLCNQCHLGGEHGYDVDDPRLTKPSCRAPRPSASVPRPGV